MPKILHVDIDGEKLSNCCDQLRELCSMQETVITHSTELYEDGECSLKQMVHNIAVASRNKERFALALLSISEFLKNGEINEN